MLLQLAQHYFLGYYNLKLDIVPIHIDIVVKTLVNLRFTFSNLSGRIILSRSYFLDLSMRSLT